MTFIARIAETHLLPPILRCQRLNRSKAEMIAAKSLIVAPYRRHFYGPFVSTEKGETGHAPNQQNRTSCRRTVSPKRNARRLQPSV